MRQGIFLLGCICCLFITNTTSQYLGIGMVGLASYGILICLFLQYLFFDFKKVLQREFRLELYVIIVFILYSSLKLIDNQIEAIQSAFFFLVIPMMTSIIVRIQSVLTKNKIIKIILAFFLINCFIAIMERIFTVNIFPYKEEILNIYINQKKWEFRSSALLGHPLKNALCTATILGFILISNFSNRYKVLCLVLGALSLLCFNARGAILITAIISLYNLYLMYKRSGQVRPTITLLNVFFISLFLFSFYYLVTETSLGGRLYNAQLIDGSAKTRLQVFDSFLYIKNYDLWIGNPSLYEHITFKLGAAGIENSYIVLILYYGILFGIPIIILLISYIIKFIKRYRFSDRVTIICSFLVIGSMNNSLAGATPWIVLILCMQTFPYLQKSVKRTRLRFS